MPLRGPNEEGNAKKKNVAICLKQIVSICMVTDIHPPRDMH
jgi:hypothetical protein